MSKSKKKKPSSVIVSIGFLLTFLFSNVILFVYALFNWLGSKKKK